MGVTGIELYMQNPMLAPVIGVGLSLAAFYLLSTIQNSDEVRDL